MWWILELAVGTFLAASTIASPISPSTANKRYLEEQDGVKYNVFEHSATKSRLSFVKNSGICETTPGVNQYSGYLSVGEGMNMWFWFFEARENPRQAPLVAYFEGGPGDASEYGFFTQNVPCHFVNNETSPSLNPYSVGFSYGNATVNSTKAAAPLVWNLLQAFYDSFPEYENRDFGIFTESYGGHYGPEFASYILDQNAAISRGDLHAEEIRLVALGVSNGWFDATIQEKANIEYLYNNSYRQLINETFYKELLTRYDTKCKPAFDRCADVGTTDTCFAAWKSCMDEIEYPILGVLNKDHPGFYLGDIRDPSLRAPSTHVAYLQRLDVQEALGAKVNYSEPAGAAGFIYSGDVVDARSFMTQLSAVVQASVRVVVWTGDADYVSNWLGTLRVVDLIEWPGKKTFTNQDMTPYTLNGTQKGVFKSLDNLTFMRIFEAGHHVPFYRTFKLTRPD
ncbi:putative carboxypeptidase S1 [Daldinia loculata]|uniref:putative carboxypeptidase S1 n=1 Tax=Daldinia loculata TaxID=103429 RepID=UPI0020C4A9E6|nr:putative carboxypeptidase S1 [Daldinia loculata]KAI1642073.1 putative carboxypeptidase S1 [Daldinia loculata]